MKKRDEQLHIKVYSRWVANKLKNVETCHVNDITKDLADGTALIELAHILTGKKIPTAYMGKSKSKFHQIEKCEYAISVFSENGVKLGMSEATISGSDINNKNVKQTLSLIWLLILNYSIDPVVRENNDFKFHSKNINIDLNNIAKRNSIQLLSWAMEKIDKYPHIDENFCPYDLSLCALLSTYFPQEINYGKLNPNDHEANLRLANSVMERHQIPVYIRPEDLKDSNYKIDEGSLMTQLSAVKESLDGLFPSRRSLVKRKKSNQNNRLSDQNDQNFNNSTSPKDGSSKLNERSMHVKPNNQKENRIGKSGVSYNDQNPTNKKEKVVDKDRYTAHSTPSSPKQLRIRINGKLDNAIVISIKRKSHKPNDDDYPPVKYSSSGNHSKNRPNSHPNSPSNSRNKSKSSENEECKIIPIYNKNDKHHDEKYPSEENEYNVKVKYDNYEVEENFPNSVSGMQVYINKNKKKRM